MHGQRGRVRSAVTHCRRRVRRLRHDHGRVLGGTGRRTRQLLRRSGTGVRGAVHAVGRTRTRGRHAHATHRRLASFGRRMRGLRGTTLRRGVTHGVRGLHRGRRHGGSGGTGRTGTPRAPITPGMHPVRTKSCIHVGKRADIKRIVRVDKGGTIIVFKLVGAGIGTRQLRQASTPGTTPLSDGTAFIDDRARSQVCRGGLGFGRSVSIENVHKSRTVRTIACFVSSTVLMKIDHMHVLRNANANVLHALVQRCLTAIPKMTRFRSRRMRFNNTNVAIISLGWALQSFYACVQLLHVFTRGLRLFFDVGSVERLCHVNAKPSDDRAVKPHGTTRRFLTHGPRTTSFRMALCNDLTTAKHNRVASMTVLSALRPRTPMRVL